MSRISKTYMLKSRIFSMWPLLKKDGLGIQYLAVTLFWNYSLGLNPLELPSSAVKLLSLVSLAVESWSFAEMFRPVRLLYHRHFALAGDGIRPASSSPGLVRRTQPDSLRCCIWSSLALEYETPRGRGLGNERVILVDVRCNTKSSFTDRYNPSI